MHCTSEYIFFTSLLVVLRTRPMTVAAEDPSELQNKGTTGYSRFFLTKYPKFFNVKTLTTLFAAVTALKFPLFNFLDFIFIAAYIRGTLHALYFICKRETHIPVNICMLQNRSLCRINTCGHWKNKTFRKQMFRLFDVSNYLSHIPREIIEMKKRFSNTFQMLCTFVHLSCQHSAMKDENVQAPEPASVTRNCQKIDI